jgi:capsular exopolysaccharide synthesis family protein
VFLDDPHSLAAEAYRVLRTSLYRTLPSPRSVLVTSAEVGAGKSSVTANLGISLAQLDHSVLLVDADLRRPVLHTLLRVPNVLGLSSYLAGTTPLEAVVARTSVANLFLLPCGPTPPNPSDILSFRRMRELLQAVTEQYDLVLLDSPPVLVASDATTLAPLVDGTLLVVGNQVPEAVVRRAKEQLEAVHACILGAVVNQREVRHAGHGVLDELARAPQAAVRLRETARAVAALGAGVAARSRRRLRAAELGARTGLASASRAAAVRLGAAGRGATALGTGVAARSRRGLRAVELGARTGLASVARAAAARLAGVGRAAAALGAEVAGRSRRGLRAAELGAQTGLASASRATAARLAGAGRAAAARGAGVAGRSRRGLRAAELGAQAGLASASRAAAARLGDVRHALAALGAGVAGQSRRGLHAAELGVRTGLASVSRATAVRLGAAGRAAAARGAGVAGQSRRGLHAAELGARTGLASVSRAAAARLGAAGRVVTTVGITIAETSQSWLGHVRGRALRTSMTVVGGLATGLALVLIPATFFGRPAADPDRMLPIAGIAPAHQEVRITPAAAQGTSTHREPARGRVAEARRPAVAPPATSLEVVAIRFGVIDRQPSDWTWSWRVTVYKPDDAARVNARIEYLEFQGSTRHLVGYEQLCGLELAGGRLESIEGIRTISAADAQRISTMTATFSPATEGAGRACLPSRSRVRTSSARGSHVGT